MYNSWVKVIFIAIFGYYIYSINLGDDANKDNKITTNNISGNTKITTKDNHSDQVNQGHSNIQANNPKPEINQADSNHNAKPQSNHSEVKQTESNISSNSNISAKKDSNQEIFQVETSNPIILKAVSYVNDFVNSDRGEALFNRLFTKNNNYSPMIMVKDVTVGKGEAVRCGQIAKVKMTLYDENSEVIVNQKDVLTEISLNKNNQFADFKNGMIGMQKQGKRIIFPTPILNEASKKYDRIEVELIDFHPPLPLEMKEIKILDTPGSKGFITQCGDIVNFNIIISNLKKQELFNSSKNNPHPIQLDIGNPNAPYILNAMLENFPENEKRYAITSIDAFKNIHNKKTPLYDMISKKISNNEVVIVEVTIDKVNTDNKKNTHDRRINN